MESQANRTDDENRLERSHVDEESQNILDLVLDENVIREVAHENSKVAEVVSPVARECSFDQIFYPVHVFRKCALAKAFDFDDRKVPNDCSEN